MILNPNYLFDIDNLIQMERRVLLLKIISIIISTYITLKSVSSFVIMFTRVSDPPIFSKHRRLMTFRHKSTHSSHYLPRKRSNTHWYWNKLGRPVTVQAPMVSQSDLPFRMLLRKHGTDLCFSQMMQATNIVLHTKKYLNQYLDI